MPEIDHGPFVFGQLIRARGPKGHDDYYVEGRVLEELALLNERIPVLIVAPDRIVVNGVEQRFLPGGLVYVPYNMGDQDYEGRIEVVLSQAYVWGLLTTLIAETEGEEAALAVMAGDECEDDNDTDDFLDGCEDMKWHLYSHDVMQRDLARIMRADKR